ncbi:hypothetical protein BSR29_02405 [Boudabousia liubingyangii]|uniref:DUF3039 domain-containing protein n=1 Tax=Boudabousia liubingyangii TaxID=1921764 RepID=A0A1Q5PQB2_9ACTO|nr:DUF3039 domain-containing protein [Boudabousia liubingyangii]OKL46071.1 hypothetical protein BSR28_08380 [Boudabousia liubingyangii]OKL49818.1 hypothetical protein BSR29_02405 [Boudabousia liubingyangii]
MSDYQNPSGPEQPGGPAAEPQQAGSVGVLEKPEVKPSKNDGDNERFAHYVRGGRQVAGRMVIALCGKVWIPTRNPKDFPVCPTCKAILEASKNHGKGWPFRGDDGDKN